jgi:VWFA-related protein
MLAAVAAFVCASPLVIAQSIERDVYVAVFDKGGTPIAGLTPDYFAVREDGRDRAIIRAAMSDVAAHIAVLVDTSAFVESVAGPYRDAIAAFIMQTAAGNDVALYEFGERANRLVPFTRDPALLRDGIGRVSVRSNATPKLLDAVDLACRDLREAGARRPIIVAVSMGSADTSTKSGGTVVKLLIKDAVSLHVVALTTRPSLAVPSLSSASGRSVLESHQRLERVSAVGEGERERMQVLKEGTAKTAGALHDVASVMAIGGALERVRQDLLATYRVTYAAEGGGKPRDLQVGLMLEDVVVRVIAAPVPATPR